MRHPTDGTLRRLVDEPAAVADDDRTHVAGCATCLAELAAAQHDAATAATALAAAPEPDVDAAWRRLSQALAADRSRPVAAARRTTRWRTALRSPVVAGLGAALVLTGAGAAAATDWLQVFRTERVAPVTVREGDLVALPDLSGYGQLQVTSEPQVRKVTDADAAAEATGLDVVRLRDLPRGVTGEPTYVVGGHATAEFTFSAAKAAQTAAAAGEALPTPPPGLDGARFRLDAGPGLVQVWSESRGVPALVVARAVAPTASSSGIAFDAARDYLLTLPGLPDDVAAQLRQFSSDDGTLPLPVPAELVKTSTADVGGVPATVLTSRDGGFAGVVWVDDGVVNGVAGSLSTDEVLTVARAVERG